MPTSFRQAPVAYLPQFVLLLLVSKFALNLRALTLALWVGLARNLDVGTTFPHDYTGPLVPLFQLVVIGVGVIVFVRRRLLSVWVNHYR